MNAMKRMTVFLASLALISPLAAQTQEPIKETVSVINVEVPVRVFSDGQSVSGLTKDDFEITEGGKVQQINGFYFFHKKINPEAAPPAGVNPAQQQPAGRYFVLVFRIYQYNEDLEKGLQYLFEKVFRPEDQLLVMANNRTLSFDHLGADAEAQGKIREVLRSESLSARNQLLNYVHSIEQNLNMAQFKMKLRNAGRGGGGYDAGPDYLENFLQSYLMAWKDFKRHYLSLELDKFYYFAKHLEKIRKEKWVLNFYQLEQFPQIALGSETENQLRNYFRNLQESENPTLIAQGRSLEKLLQSIDMEMNVAKDFPAEEASKLFYKVNATFHSFFMRVFTDMDSSELQFRQVATDIENGLRELTRTTGGTLAASNDVAAGLAAVSEKTDDYYMLTYEPANPKKIGKIKVTVKNKKYKVLYDDNMRADYISEYLAKKDAESPSVKIKELAFKDGKLSFVITDFSMAKVKGETTGVLSVRIRVLTAGQQSVFDQTKSLQAAKSKISLSLGFNSLAAGRYDIIVDVLDQVSGRTCTEIIQPLVR
jgi:VWFA-related protein